MNKNKILYLVWTVCLVILNCYDSSLSLTLNWGAIFDYCSTYPITLCLCTVEINFWPIVFIKHSHPNTCNCFGFPFQARIFFPLTVPTQRTFKKTNKTRRLVRYLLIFLKAHSPPTIQNITISVLFYTNIIT